MYLSEEFPISSFLLCKFSPDGHYLAVCVQNILRLRKTSNLNLTHTYTCTNPIQYIEWSDDSEFVLCAQYKYGTIQVWSLDEPMWTCQIDEGSIGVISARWAVDSRHILTTSEFYLRITVWSLVNKSVSYIKYPKEIEKNLSFSKDKLYLAVAERRNCRDYLSIFSTELWQLLKHFECATKDLAGIEWCPNEHLICAWDSLLDYKILLYTIEGQCLGSYEAYKSALGIKTVNWSPTGQFVAVGSYDQQVRILYQLTWDVAAQHLHTPTVIGQNVIVYQEDGNQGTNLTNTSSGLHALNTYVIVHSRPVKIPSRDPDPSKPNPKLGVGKALFSWDGQYLATRNDNSPNTVWIWNMAKLSLAAVLIQKQSVTCMAWDPTKSRLALCTGTTKIFFWTPEECMEVSSPQFGTINIIHIEWNSQGNSLLASGKETSCICYTDRQNLEMVK